MRIACFGLLAALVGACQASATDEDNAAAAASVATGPAAALWNDGVARFERAGIRYFSRPDDALRQKIAYASVQADGEFNGTTVLIVPGFSENHFKYAELGARLVRAGFDVVAINLRGMGYSDRYAQPDGMSAELHRQVVHVADLSDYAKDIRHLLSRELASTIRGRLVIFAHSTGGLAATEFLAEWPRSAEAVVLNSPLFGLNLAWHEAAITSLISPTLPQTWPPRGSQTPWSPVGATFSDQTDTSSPERWERYNRFLTDHSDVVQAYPSRGWVQAVKEHTTDERLTRLARAFTVPTLLMQAGGDTYVDTTRQDFVGAALRRDMPASARCLELTNYPHEYHSIWRGVHHEAVFERILAQFSKRGC